MKKRILMVIDTQVDFMLPDGALWVPGAEKLIAPMVKHLMNAEGRYDAVIFTMDMHSPAAYAESEEGKEFPPHCVAGTRGARNVLPMIGLDVPSYIVRKDKFDVWEGGRFGMTQVDPPYRHALDLENWFRHNGGLSGVKPTVDVMGVAADYCVKYAVNGLFKRGFTAEVLEELTRGIHKQWADIDPWEL